MKTEVDSSLRTRWSSLLDKLEEKSLSLQRELLHPLKRMCQLNQLPLKSQPHLLLKKSQLKSGLNMIKMVVVLLTKLNAENSFETCLIDLDRRL